MTKLDLHDPLKEKDDLKSHDMHALTLHNANLVKSKNLVYSKKAAQSAQPLQYRQRPRLYTRRQHDNADAHTDDEKAGDTGPLT